MDILTQIATLIEWEKMVQEHREELESSNHLSELSNEARKCLMEWWNRGVNGDEFHPALNSVHSEAEIFNMSTDLVVVNSGATNYLITFFRDLAHRVDHEVTV